MKISVSQIRAAEEIASDVFDGRLSASEGAARLASDHGLNISSARDYIGDYKCMMQGRMFPRSMSAPAVNYFLEMIRERRGANYHALAVGAVDSHISYYEGIRRVRLHSMRLVVDLHRASSGGLNLSDHVSSFNQAVASSLGDSSAQRQDRLKGASKSPTRILVSTYAFIRNPDVVAEIIIRAAGKCESCNKSAPFLKKKDGQPYLEVHHIIPLAEGGEDTVANAIALCPNCHRQMHYGISS